MQEAKSKKIEPRTTKGDYIARARRLNLSDEQLVEFFSTMCTIRQFELMADKLYAMGKVHGTMHLSAGQEAVAVGTFRAVRVDDYVLNHHRGHGHFIAKGADINRMMAEFLGKDTGYCRGRGGSMHIADVEANNLGANGIVGGGIPQSVGVGLALQMKKLDQICVVLFGDGAANEGVFHESLNMAALWSLPVLFICENNKYGMSMDVEHATAKLPIAQRAEAYGMPWAYVDGNDVLEVYETMIEATRHVRSGRGPVLVEAVTYRYFGHSKSDRNLYRTKDEIEDWKKHRDPILRFKGHLLHAGIFDEAKAAEIDAEALNVIEKAVEFAEASPEPDLSTLTEFVYA
ncbi:MAG: thiamine pyrophosphate-dependent dehydrogenase E1 component subunit alpha [Chloroflexi bacterium]|nr:thiamine pyrophosphate-dependent dehydrogenase E1 component subunit alpha [Chloroflexota bacterium]